MPVVEQSISAKQNPGLPMKSTIHSATQQQSFDSVSKEVAAILTSAILKKRGRNKKVHWDISTVDNEKLPKAPSSRPSSSPPIPSGVLPKGLAFAISATSQSTSIIVPRVVANTTMKIDSPSTRQAQSAVPGRQRMSPKQDPQHQTQRTHQTVAAVASTRLSTQTPSGHGQEQSPAANSASILKPSSATHGTSRIEVEMKVTKASPPRHKHHSKTHRSAATASPVPPQVPDPPQPRFQAPPPTPRITRLPTPELPEFEEDRFCSCCDDRRGRGHAKVCELYDRDVANCKKPVHVKMDAQLEAAKAYMKYMMK